VPLQQTFIGLTETNAMKRLQIMNETAFDIAMSAIRKGKQVMQQCSGILLLPSNCCPLWLLRTQLV
jgi:hypothetical protein